MDVQILNYIAAHPCWSFPYGTAAKYWSDLAEFLNDLFLKGDYKSHMHSNSLNAVAVRTQFNLLVKHFHDMNRDAQYRSRTQEKYATK